MNPRQGTGNRNALPSYDTALTNALHMLGPDRKPAGATEGIEENVLCSKATGRVLAQPVMADRDLPPFNRAQVDGYALRAAEFGRQKRWPVVATVSAGQCVTDLAVPPGTCVAIATGAALPADVDTVIQHEWSDRGDRAGKPVTFTVDSINAGHAVHPRGADAQEGDVILAPGTLLAPHHLGIAAMVGTTTLSVVPQMRIVLLTSGDEVLPAGAAVKPYQIRNSNAPLLVALVEQMGGRIERHEHLPDQREATIQAFDRATHDADLIVTVGGVSAGDKDYFHEALDAHNVDLSVRGAAIQPGRPIAVGRIAGGAIVVALPGNPVSALVCATLFIWPLVRALAGLSATLPWREVELAREVKPNPKREAFRPAIMRSDQRVEVPDWAGSGDLVHTAPTAGIVQLPLQQEFVAAGTTLRFLSWPNRSI